MSAASRRSGAPPRQSSLLAPAELQPAEASIKSLRASLVFQPLLILQFEGYPIPVGEPLSGGYSNPSIVKPSALNNRGSLSGSACPVEDPRRSSSGAHFPSSVPSSRKAEGDQDHQTSCANSNRFCPRYLLCDTRSQHPDHRANEHRSRAEFSAYPHPNTVSVPFFVTPLVYKQWHGFRGLRQFTTLQPFAPAR